MQFSCRLGTPEGRVVEDVFEASDETALRQELAQKGYHLFEVRRRGLLGKMRLLAERQGTKRIGLRELQIFNQELAALLRSGLPMVQALELVLARQRNPVFRRILGQVVERVKSGEELSSAIAGFGERFPPLYSATLKAGERSGEMEQVIRRFVRYLDLVLETRKKVVSALVYPSALVGLSITLIAVMTVFVLPKFTDFFSSLRVDLPMLTRITMGVSLFVKDHLFLIVLMSITVAVGVLQFTRTAAGKLILARWSLKIPLLGSVFHRMSLSEFCRSLATLLAGGIPLVASLEVAVRAVSNPYLRSKLEPTIRAVREGRALADTLNDSGATSDIVVDMVEVGETTGSLDTMLSEVSDFLDEEVDTHLERVLSLLEPVMLVLMGIIVATLLISVYLPLFSLLGRVQA